MPYQRIGLLATGTSCLALDHFLTGEHRIGGTPCGGGIVGGSDEVIAVSKIALARSLGLIFIGVVGFASGDPADQIR